MEEVSPTCCDAMFGGMSAGNYLRPPPKDGFAPSYYNVNMGCSAHCNKKRGKRNFIAFLQAEKTVSHNTLSRNPEKLSNITRIANAVHCHS